MSIKGGFAIAGGMGFIWLFFVALAFIIGAILWPYTINSWLVYAGKPPCIEWWHGGLIGLVPAFGQFSIPAAIITWILMMILSPVAAMVM